MADGWADGIQLPLKQLSSGSSDAVFALPVFTLVSGGDGVVTSLPLFTMSASGTGNSFLAALSLPLFTLEADGTFLWDADLVLPAKTLAAAGFAGAAGSGAIEMPMKTLFSAQSGLIETLPALVLGATGLGGVLGGGDNSLPALTLLAIGTGQNIGYGGSVLPLLALAGSARVGGVGSVAAVLPRLYAIGGGFNGAAAAAALTLPLLRLTGVGYPAYVGVGGLELPLFVLAGTGTQSVAALYRAWVLNTRRAALTEYSGLQVNSLAEFNGVVLGATPTGIVVIGASKTDNGTAITGTVRPGMVDYGEPHQKRVPRMYLNYSTDGDAEFSTITSQDGRRTYLLNSNGIKGIQQRRVPIGRGPKSRYWQYEYKNRDGADFAISSFEPYPKVLGRRI